jgi:hypothetical protein
MTMPGDRVRLEVLKCGLEFLQRLARIFEPTCPEGSVENRPPPAGRKSSTVQGVIATFRTPSRCSEKSL